VKREGGRLRSPAVNSAFGRRGVAGAGAGAGAGGGGCARKKNRHQV